MVRTEEEREKRIGIGMAREGSNAVVASSPSKFVGSYEDVYNKDDMKTRDRLDRMEKDIVRITMIAEKDKRDSIACTNKIKKLKEQLLQLSDNNNNAEGEEMRRCHSESDLIAQLADRYGVSVSPPPPSLPSFRGLATSSSYHLDTENKSPNISPASSPISEDCKLRDWDRMYAKKEDELARVKLRAKEEAARAAALRHEEEEMKKLLARETQARMRANEDMKVAIARKEREIQRLSVLAERDKRTGMFMRDKITHHKRTLASFVSCSARSEKKPDLLRVLNSCDEIELPISPATPSTTTSSSYGSSMAGSVSPLSLTPTSPSGLLVRTRSASSGASGYGGGPSSPLRAETDSLMRAHSCKEEELSRVSAIAGAEACRVSVLKTKCDEIQHVITSELQEVNERLELKLKQIRNQQDAIHKVMARAEFERAKACALHEELNNLRAKCSEKSDAKPAELKKSEFLPDKAYFSEFKELSDLIPVSDINTANDPTANPSNDKTNNPHHPHHAHSFQHSPTKPCGCVDPLMYIQSPPSKQVSLAESQDVYAQKLQDLVTLDRESARLDEELARVKQVKEAEYMRRILLAQKLKDIKEDPDYIRLLQ